MVEAASLALHFTYMSGRDEIVEMLRCATRARRAHARGGGRVWDRGVASLRTLVVVDAPNRARG